MTLYPSGMIDIYQKLHDGISSYAGILPPQEKDWLLKAVAQALQMPPGDLHHADRLFSNPIKVAELLIREKQSVPIIVASLIYGRIKIEGVSDDAYQKKLRVIAEEYSPEISNFTRYALQEAYTDMPAVGDALKRSYDKSNRARKKHLEEEKKKAKRAKPMQTLEERQTATFIRYVNSRNPLPQSQAIRIADRWVLLQEIDPDNATPEQKARIKESWLIHAQMANNLGMRNLYYDFGDMYIRAFYPETYAAITKGLRLMATAINAKGDPLETVTDYLGARIEKELRVLPRSNVEQVDGGYYIKKRDKKSVISIWTKLIGDGIDPEEFFKNYAEQIDADPKVRLKILITEVMKEIYDLFAFTVIVDEKALIERKLIADPKNAEAENKHYKPWHVHRNACSMVADLLARGCDKGRPLEDLGYSVLKDRTKNYFEKPRGGRYRSLHMGIAIKVSLAEIGIDELSVPIEVIFRTPQVHFEAEHGQWAHNRYKNERINGHATWQSAQGQVTEREKVYLFTPDGEIMEFKKGTRVRDLGFEINQDIGLYCTGATVYRGYETWRKGHTTLPELAQLTADSTIDDFDGCTFIVESVLPPAVKEMRKEGIKGYDRLPPGYSERSLEKLLESVTTDISERKIRAILAHVRTPSNGMATHTPGRPNGDKKGPETGTIINPPAV